MHLQSRPQPKNDIAIRQQFAAEDGWIADREASSPHHVPGQVIVRGVFSCGKAHPPADLCGQNPRNHVLIRNRWQASARVSYGIAECVQHLPCGLPPRLGRAHKFCWPHLMICEKLLQASLQSGGRLSVAVSQLAITSPREDRSIDVQLTEQRNFAAESASDVMDRVLDTFGNNVIATQCPQSSLCRLPHWAIRGEDPYPVRYRPGAD